MITRIESPNELRGGVSYRMYQIDNELEAASLVEIGQRAMLYKSKIVNAFYLFVEEA